MESRKKRKREKQKKKKMKEEIGCDIISFRSLLSGNYQGNYSQGDKQAIAALLVERTRKHVTLHDNSFFFTVSLRPARCHGQIVIPLKFVPERAIINAAACHGGGRTPLYVSVSMENNIASYMIRSLSQACRPIDTRAIAPEVILRVRDGRAR